MFPQLSCWSQDGDGNTNHNNNKLEIAMTVEMRPTMAGPWISIPALWTKTDGNIRIANGPSSTTTSIQPIRAPRRPIVIMATTPLTIWVALRMEEEEEFNGTILARIPRTLLSFEDANGFVP